MWLSIILISCIHLLAMEREPRWIAALSKPLPILLMALLAFTTPSADSTLAVWIGAGLVLSAVSNVLMLLPNEKFLAGISLMLITHMCYVVGFISMVDSITWWTPALLLALGILIFLLLLPGLGNMMIPVATYILLIVILGSATLEYWMAYQNTSAKLALAGAGIFMFSDLVLAIDRFRTSSKYSRHVVMFSYYAAQGLITLAALNQ